MLLKRNRRATFGTALIRGRAVSSKIDRACLGVSRRLFLPAGLGGLFLAQTASAQVGTETYKTNLSDIQITQTAGVGSPASITNPSYIIDDVKGALTNATASGTTAAAVPILTYSQVSAATSTYQLINTFTNSNIALGPPSSSAYASIGESDSYSLGMGVYMGAGTGITQTNPGGAYPYASELSVGVKSLAYYINASAGNPFPSARAPAVAYQFPIAGTLPVGGSANFGVTLSFYFFASTNTTSFTFPNTGGTLVTSVSLSEAFTNTTGSTLFYTNTTNASLYSGHAQFYGLADQLITKPGYFEIVGSINFKSIVDSQPGLSQGGSFSTSNGSWTAAPTTFEMYLPQVSMFTAGPGAGNVFDATGTFDLSQAPSWNDITNGTQAQLPGPPSTNDIAQFDNGILLSAKQFTLNTPTTWGGISVVNPGAAVTIASGGAGTNTLTIGGLGIAIGPGAASNGVSQNLTLSGPVALSSGQTWYVAGGQTLTVGGATLALGDNIVDVQGAGNVVVTAAASDLALGGGFQMDGSGILTLSGNNGFIGGITLNNGEVSVGSDTNLCGAGSAVNFNGGILQVNGTTLNNLNNHIVNWNSFTGGFDITSAANTFTVSQNIGNAATDSGSLTKLGGGTLVLNGVNTYFGPTTIGGGALLIPHSNTLNPASNIIINSAGGLEALNAVVINNPIQVNLASGEFVALTARGAAMTLAGPITTGSNPSFQYNLGTPVQEAAIMVTGASTVTGNQPTTISEGSITFENNGSLTASVGGSPGIVFGGGPSAFFNLTLMNSSSITNRSSTGGILENGSITIFNQASLNLGAGILTLTNATDSLDLFGGTFTSGGMSWGNANSDLIMFNGGVMAAGASNANFLPAAGNGITLRVSAGGFKFDTEGFTDTIGTDAGFTRQGADGGVTKEGPGILIFTSNFGSENVNNYSGPTTVDGGLLELPGSSSTVAFNGTSYILTNSGGAVGVDDGSLSDATFIGKVASVNLPAVQSGALALAPADANTNIDFTGTVGGAFNMKQPVAGSVVSIVNMSIGALSGGVNYVATITPAAVGGFPTYQLGGGGVLTLGKVTVGNNSGVGIPLVNVNGVASNVLVENGGAVNLTTTNTYTGSTTINGVMVEANDLNETFELEQTTLQVSHLADNASSIGNSSNIASNLVINGGVLQYVGAGDTSSRLFTIGPSGATIDSSGAGALTLSNIGAEQFFDGSSASTTLTLSGSNGGLNTLDGGLSDPSPGVLTLVKSGTGFWQLAANNSYSGGTILAGGTLEITSDSNIGGPNSAIYFDGGTLRFTGNTITNLDNHAVNWSTFNGGIHVNAGGVFTISENLGGTGSLTKQGNGELILSGTNTFTGGTTINAGTLAINDFSQLGSGPVVDNGTILLNISTPVTYSGFLVGTGGLTDNSPTTLTLNGGNSFTGTTTMTSDSTLILDYSTDALPLPILAGSLSLSGSTLLVNSNGMFNVFQTFSGTTFAVGSSSVIVNAPVTGLVNLNLGAITRNAGATVQFNSPVSGASSSIQTTSSSPTAALLAVNISGQNTGYATFGAFDWAATTASSGGNAFIVPGSAIAGFYTPFFSTTSYSASSNLDVIGTNQKLILASPPLGSLRFNTPTGGFFNDGTNSLDQVYISNTITVGAFLVTPNVGNNTVLITPNSTGNNQNTQDIVLSGGGEAVFWQNNTGGLLVVNTGINATDLIKQGPGIMALNATSTYSGPTYIERGILQVSYDAALGTGSTLDLFGGSVMAIQSLTTSRNISVGPHGGGLIAADGTTLTVNGVISSSGAVNVGLPTLVTDAQLLSNSSNHVSFSSTFGSGLVVFNDSNSYTGPTNINAGQLRLGNAGALGGTSALNIAALATLDLNGNSISIPTLNGAGTIDDNTAGGNLTINVTGSGNSTFSGVIRNTTGVVGVTQSGGGTLVLSGSNTFTGPTNLVGGELSISSAANISSIINFQGGVLQVTGTTLQNFSSQQVNWAAFNGGFDIANPGNTFTIAQNIGGTGSLLKIGVGTLALTASNSYSGGTDIEAGALLIPNQTALGSGPVIDNGAIIFSSNGTTTFGGNLTGSGNLIVSGGINLILTGANSSTGQITVNPNSTLSVNNPGALLPAVQVLNNGNLAVNANVSVGGVNGNGATTVAGGVTFYASGITQSSLVNNGNTTIGCGGTIGSLTGVGVLTVGTASMVGDLQISPHKSTHSQNGLTIIAGSQLDITNNALAINYGAGPDPVATLLPYIKSGYNGGTWTGNGLTSSYAASNPNQIAVGYADGSVDVGTQAQQGQVLIKTTVNGDTNLDGSVNFSDLVAVVQNFNKTNTDWAHGNFEYGASTNFLDLVVVVQNFGRSTASLLDAGLPTQTVPLTQFNQSNIASTDVTLPEPAFTGLAFVVGAGIIARRRRRVV